MSSQSFGTSSIAALSAVGKGSFQTENLGHHKNNHHNINGNQNHHAGNLGHNGGATHHPVMIKVGSLKR